MPGTRGTRHPPAAFCEEFDEDTNAVLPDTRQVANVAAKRSRPELRAPGISPDGNSDSGYSSRTAATVGSGDSAPRQRKGPAPLKVDTAPRHRDVDRIREKDKERDKQKFKLREKFKEKIRDKGHEREGRSRASEDMPGSTHHSLGHRAAPVQRSNSKAQRRESMSMAPPMPPGGCCWECETRGYHHSSTPVESRSMNSYTPPYIHQPAPPYDVAPSPQSPRYYPQMYTQEINASPRVRPHPRTRSTAYHNPRPVSYHSGITSDSTVYTMSSRPQQYEHGPPISHSAYANTPIYSSSPSYGSPFLPREPHMPQSHEMPPPSPYERSRASSSSRHAEHYSGGRRGSVYERPVIEYNGSSSYYGAPLERASSRDQRVHAPESYDTDEDFYRQVMPPPPIPNKKKPPPQVIPVRPTVRKSATTSSTHRPSAFDMSDLRTQLPDRPERPLRVDSRESVPERRPSVSKHNGRTTSYHESSRSGRMSIEEPPRRRASVYGAAERPKDMEQKHKEAEQYQAARASRATPLTTDALMARPGTKAGSESGSLKSRSNSSRGSGSRSRYGNGSAVGSSRPDDDGITMTIQGVTIGLTGESMEGKQINVRSGEEGAFELNFAGRKPKKYLMSASEYSSTGSRREIEDVRRIRDREDRRSDRASRRSSRSGYS